MIWKVKRADADSILREIIKSPDFIDVTKDNLGERITQLLIDEKLFNKIKRKLNSYSVNNVNAHPDYDNIQLVGSILSNATPENVETTDLHMPSQTPVKDSVTPITNVSILATDYVTLDNKCIANENKNSSEKYIDCNK